MIGEGYTVRSACVPIEETNYPFIYDESRDFQAEFVEWMNEGDEPVVALNAPTGAGKTATFHQLIEDSEGVVLLVYPTNALIRDQKSTLEDELDVTVEHVTGAQLNRHGIERGTELKSYFEKLGTDVVITNPDVLQAVVQGAYVDPAGRLVELFEYCSAVVYDEFHFYDEFAASGILLQTKIAVRRMSELGDARIVFSSATPDETYFELLEELGISHRYIVSNISDEGDRFRYETTVHTEQSRIGDITQTVLHKIHDNVEQIESLEMDEYRIAVICNSVKASNQLYNQFLDEYPDLREHTVKDNGYDTGADTEEQGAILITTSKAEVGLDHDIEYLHMDEPYNNPDSFIQRFGRAGRDSPATVHVYGLGVVRWSEEMSYDEFVEQVYETMNENHANKEKVRSLIGLRAAHALYTRQNTKTQTVRDLEATPEFDYWYTFLKTLDEQRNGYVRRDHQNILTIIEQSLDTLNTLRGESYNVTIEYQRDNERVVTDYSLLSAITQYAVSHVEDERVILDGSRIPLQHSFSVKGLTGQFNLDYISDLQDVKTRILDDIEEISLPDQYKHYAQIMNPENLTTIDTIQLNTYNGVIEYEPY